MASFLLFVLFPRHAGLLKKAGHFVAARTSKMDVSFLFCSVLFFSLLKLGKRHSCVMNVVLI